MFSSFASNGGDKSGTTNRVINVGKVATGGVAGCAKRASLNENSAGTNSSTSSHARHPTPAQGLNSGGLSYFVAVRFIWAWDS